MQRAVARVVLSLSSRLSEWNGYWFPYDGETIKTQVEKVAFDKFLILRQEWTFFPQDLCGAKCQTAVIKFVDEVFSSMRNNQFTKWLKDIFPQLAEHIRIKHPGVDAMYQGKGKGSDAFYEDVAMIVEDCRFCPRDDILNKQECVGKLVEKYGYRHGLVAATYYKQWLQSEEFKRREKELQDKMQKELKEKERRIEEIVQVRVRNLRVKEQEEFRRKREAEQEHARKEQESEEAKRRRHEQEHPKRMAAKQAAELAFLEHAAEVQKQFSYEQFQVYAKDYLHDNCELASVESHAAAFPELLQKYAIRQRLMELYEELRAWLTAIYPQEMFDNYLETYVSKDFPLQNVFAAEVTFREKLRQLAEREKKRQAEQTMHGTNQEIDRELADMQMLHELAKKLPDGDPHKAELERRIATAIGDKRYEIFEGKLRRKFNNGST